MSRISAKLEAEIEALFPISDKPPQPKGMLAAFANGRTPKRAKPAPEEKVKATVTTLATPEVREAIAKIQSHLKRHGVASEFTRQGEIIRRAILAYAESYD